MRHLRPDGRVYRIEKGAATEYFASACTLHLVAGRGAGRRAVRRHGRPGQSFPRYRSGRQGEVYYETGQSHVTGAGAGCAGPPAGGHRAERHSLPRFRQGQGVRALRREPAGDPRHRARRRTERSTPPRWAVRSPSVSRGRRRPTRRARRERPCRPRPPALRWKRARRRVQTSSLPRRTPNRRSSRAPPSPRR